MKILVYGAGVLGSLYAARLNDSGQDVTILARGQRLAEIQQYGILLEDALTGERTCSQVDVVSTLHPGAAYDLILVIVRRNQVQSVLLELRANWNSPAVLFMSNNAAGYQDLEVIGKERLLLGFPGAGGTREGNLVRYLLSKRQATPIGEPDGRYTPRLEQIGEALRGAGFRVAYQQDMDAWLRTHVALISPLVNAIYGAGGDVRVLAKDQEALSLVVQAVREGFRVLNVVRFPIIPGRLRWLARLPDRFLLPLLQKNLDSDLAELAIARHGNAARDEMKTLAGEFQALIKEAAIPTPAIDQLYGYIIDYQA